uniref:Uncharacterized protein n=1 Tax=Amphimedon queenslandica TaxID=400682 RepID=A0A1X7SIJ1_AMPQE
HVLHFIFKILNQINLLIAIIIIK